MNNRKTFFSVRGILGSSVMLSYNIGMLLAFISGAFFTYDVTPKAVCVIYFLYVILLFFVPESPQFLIKQNNISVSNFFLFLAIMKNVEFVSIDSNWKL